MLSQAAVEAFRRDGFLAPVDAFSAAEIREWRAALEAFEAGVPEQPQNRRKLHVLLPWARDIAEDPRILDAVEALIGPDILVFTSTMLIKEPKSDAVAAWHQDATFFGLTPYEHVTAWVALSDASVAAGCMRFVPGSHCQGQRRHVSGMVRGSINAGAQMLGEAVDAAGAVYAPLEPGQFSLHHTLVIHDSAPNHGADRRIGFGISYIPVHVRHTGTRPPSASLVRGIDPFGHFDLEPDPRPLAPAQRTAAHERATRAHRAAYEEQMALHRRTFA
ncbi:MAG: phytanoyl-CoA dioxygenase family protein [Stellaceae bacterium]